MHDVLDLRDLVPDEAEQLASSGYPARELETEARAAAAGSDLAALREIRKRLGDLARLPSWGYEEPSDEAAVFSSPKENRLLPVSGRAVADRIYGAWLGRCLGCTMGKPVEGLSSDEVTRYLDAVPDWPQRGFLPLLAELPPGVSHLHESAPYSTAGNFDCVPRDDDIDWTILGLHLLEKYGRQLTTADIAREWLDRLAFTQTFTAERAAYRNLVSGVSLESVALVDNPYREWIGALIRADMFGYAYPGNPGAAARLAFTDARLSHTANGIYGEVWAAALVSSALVAASTEEVVVTALEYVPGTSRFYEAQDKVLGLYREGWALEDAMEWYRGGLGQYNWVHSVNNGALIAIALLWGRGDFLESVALAIRGGEDTDSDAATVGSVMGALLGSAGVPGHLASAFNNRVRSAVRDFDRIGIDELAERTVHVADRCYEESQVQ